MSRYFLSILSMHQIIMLFILTILIPENFNADELEGKVVSVTDGDTITMLVGKKQIKVRLAEIDTPESGQPYGKKAKQVLASLVFGKKITVNVIDIDRYGRSIGKVYNNGLDVNSELISRGAAWVYRKYSMDSSLLAIENQARKERVGLWQLNDAERIPPWEWRHSEKLRRHHEKPSDNIIDSNCGNKKYCREMYSCSEAKMYLSNCGLTRIDGDGDGMPCETLCR